MKLRARLHQFNCLCLVLLCSLALTSSAQYAAPAGQSRFEFQFIRLAYTAHPDFTRGFGRWESWMTDAPPADIHFLQGVRRLTRINAGEEGKGLRPIDDALFDYPFIYAVEVGHWYLTDADAQHLREYLLRGGFLMVDDFHGTIEWATFMESMQRVFPDRQVVELADTDEVFHVLYDLDLRVQIPNVWNAMNGRTYEKDGYTPHWRGIYDDDGRLMVAINFNMDLGDGWEHADNPLYPQRYTVLAYRFGINYLLYSMTH